MVDQAKMKDIIASILSGEPVSIDDGIDVWTFDTTQQHEKEVMGQLFVSLASNVHQQFLYRRATDALSIHTPVFLIDERGTALNNISISELINKKEIYKITSKMREGKIKEYQSLIDQYADCPGSLYWIALELALAVYDERGSEEIDTVSQQLFKTLAEKGDARACHELANHYYFNTAEKDEVIKWRTLAIQGGETADLKELADFIIDEYPEKIALALDTLHQMQQYGINAAWAYWKEGSIYKEGLDQLAADPGRGCVLLQKASEAGHTVAKSDLALCYYEGVGVTKDLEKALQLLTEANEASRLVNSQYLDEDDPDTEAEGDYEEQLAQIKQELNK